MMNKLLNMREAHLTAIKHIEARINAFKANDKKYIGSPCRNGHLSGLRYTKSDICIECMIARE